jgi:cytochrome c peroxidase
MQKNNYFAIVKKHRKYTVLFGVIIAGIYTQFSFVRPEEPKFIEEHYVKRIIELKQLVSAFQLANKQQKTVAAFKTKFIQCRLAYKRLAILTEYFNPLETKSLNSPALERLTSEAPDDIAAPEGFQAIEDLLYNSNWVPSSSKKLNQYLGKIKAVLTKLENEPDKKYRNQKSLLWDALRSANLSIITLGITGFDSPTAKLSIPEARAGFEEIKILLSFLKGNNSSEVEYTKLLALINNAIKYLNRHNNFDAFNRLVFIKEHADPVYKQLCKIRQQDKIDPPGGSNPIDFSSSSIFDENAFNINFFSPGLEYWVTPERASLGKKLFFDNVLSITKNRNCGSCHNPAMAFTDGLKQPLAIDNKTPLLRNSPTLVNAAFQTKFFYDNRVSLLEGQLNEVVHSKEEMNGSLVQSVLELKKIDEYELLFHKAYPTEAEPITTYTIINALSSYIRTLISLNSRFDKYMRGDESKLSASEKNGFNLFAGKAKCATCHFIPLFNGLLPPVFNETESEVLGVPANASKKNPVLDTDEGRKGFTLSRIHKYAFKTPTLRNVELTAPYMHNGVYNTLEEVMEFYNNGGGQGLKIAPPNQTLPFDRLNLSNKEVSNIIAFMKTLTDTVTQRY